MNGHSNGNGAKTAHPAPLNIAIVGGGIGGLALALGLAQQQRAGTNIRFQIYEAASQFKEIGAGVGVGPNASAALSLLGIGEDYRQEVKGTHVPANHGLYFVWRWGEASAVAEHDGDDYIGVTPCAHAEGHTTVHRARFLDLMINRLPAGVANFNKRLSSYVVGDHEEGGIKLTFGDGSTAFADVLVAADGIKSPTRQLMLRHLVPQAQLQPRFTGTTVFRCLTPMQEMVDKIGEKARQSTMYLGKDKHILTFPIQGGATLNIVVFSSDRSSSRPLWSDKEWIVSDDIGTVLREWDGWSEDCKELLGSIRSADRWALHELEDLPTHAIGPVCLMGDAAAATLPHQGQGAAMAIESGFTLSCLLGAPGLNRDNAHLALEVFNTLRHTRVTAVKNTSHHLGRILEFADADVGMDRQKLMSNLTTRYEWIWGWRGEQDVCQGLASLAAKISANRV